ncbi:MAG: hypothetical protein LBI84_03525 [Propionibacteriaceae bacterium]|nr:hypothetical protein [Propionibacteriaceae bacterium]
MRRSPKFLSGLVRSGSLRARKVGRVWLAPKRELDRLFGG